MNYILEQPDQNGRRLTILIDMFIQDLASQIGHHAYVDELVERRIRFHDKPYELRFIAGGGMAAGPDRVWISCNLIDDEFHLATMSVNVRRPLPDIVREIHSKILNLADRQALARQEQILLYREPTVEQPTRPESVRFNEASAKRALLIIARHLCPRGAMQVVAQMALDGCSIAEINEAAGLS